MLMHRSGVGAFAPLLAPPPPFAQPPCRSSARLSPPLPVSAVQATPFEPRLLEADDGKLHSALTATALTKFGQADSSESLAHSITGSSDADADAEGAGGAPRLETMAERKTEEEGDSAADAAGGGGGSAGGDGGGGSSAGSGSSARSGAPVLPKQRSVKFSTASADSNKLGLTDSDKLGLAESDKSAGAGSSAGSLAPPPDLGRNKSSLHTFFRAAHAFSGPKRTGCREPKLSTDLRASRHSHTSKKDVHKPQPEPLGSWLVKGLLLEGHHLTAPSSQCNPFVKILFETLEWPDEPRGGAAGHGGFRSRPFAKSTDRGALGSAWGLLSGYDSARLDALTPGGGAPSGGGDARGPPSTILSDSDRSALSYASAPPPASASEPRRVHLSASPLPSAAELHAAASSPTALNPAHATWEMCESYRSKGFSNVHKAEWNERERRAAAPIPPRRPAAAAEHPGSPPSLIATTNGHL